ncbi:hypothetical protein [Streptomyces mirabilis]|uniref:hypothetical protein n=1 Tax=Streptomyces mirabilis TaxID=68239 RepID=UPI0036D7696F
MTRPAASRKQPGQATIPAGRVEVLDAGRAAAVQRRRADSEQCRQRVLAVLAAMRKSRQALSDAEITLRDTEIQELREQRDAALAASRQAETAIQALRNVNQRLMVENSRLIAADAPEPTRTAPAAPKPSG